MGRRHLRLFWVVLCILLAGCGRSIAGPTALPPVQPAATPQSTPTSEPLSVHDLERVLIAPGDLPAGISPGQIRYSLPDDLALADSAVLIVHLELAHEASGLDGGVTVLVFESEDDLDDSYDGIASDLSGEVESVAGIGDAAVVVDLGSAFFGFPRTKLLFARCNALVYVLMLGGDAEEAAGYALRLDVRLTPLVCR